MSLDRAYYKLLICARKMALYEEKTYTAHNLASMSVRQAYEHKLQIIPFNTKCYLIKIYTSFWTTLHFDTVQFGKFKAWFCKYIKYFQLFV